MYWSPGRPSTVCPVRALVRVDDLDAVAGPAQRDGHVGQRILARGRLLVLGHLLGTRLADIDDGFAIEMMVADLGGTQRQQVGRHDDRARRRGGRWRSGGDIQGCSWLASFRTAAERLLAMIWLSTSRTS